MSDTEMPAESPSVGDLYAAHTVGNPEDGEALFSGVVFVSDKEKNLLLTSKGLCLQASSKNKNKSKGEDLLLPWCDIMWAETESAESEESEQPESTFSVHYIHQQSDKRLHSKCMTVTVEEGDVGRWVGIFQEECLKVHGRPKKLYVVVNPVSGSGRGRHIYEKSVAPLFKLAQIECSVKVTDKSKQGLQIGETEDFSGYDGIVCVGGDGLYQELLQGVIVQQQKKSGVDYSNPDVDLVRPNISFGIIPAGSGNRVSGWVNDGVCDVETSALRIIRGEQHYGQAFTVYNVNKFISAGGLSCAYGLFSDMIVKGDGLRWMGRARFLFATMSILLRKRRMFKTEIEYQQMKTGSDKSEGGVSTATCPKAEWISYDCKGRNLCGVQFYAMDLVDAGEHYALNPYSKSANLYLDSGSSTMGFFKHVMMIGMGKKLATPILNLDTIENVTGFRMKIIIEEIETDDTASDGRVKVRQLEHLVNIDGEIIQLDTPQIHVRLHPSFVPLFGCLPSY